MPSVPYPSYQADQPRPLVSLTSTVSLTAAAHRLWPGLAIRQEGAKSRCAVCCSGEIAREPGHMEEACHVTHRVETKSGVGASTHWQRTAPLSYTHSTALNQTAD